MMVKVFSVAFDSVVAGFDDAEIRQFVKDKQTVSICHHFFMRSEIPYLTFVVTYRCARPPQELGAVKPSEEPWRKLLQESDMGLFNLLREWRSKRAKKEAVPPYVLFTNHQFAQIVKKRPQSFAELFKIEGIGKAKLEKYGEEILEISRIQHAESLSGESKNG